MTRTDAPAPRRRILQVATGLGTAVGVLVLLVAPVIVMLLLVPRGTPTRLPDGLAIALLAVVGLVIGWVLRVAGARTPFAVAAAGLVGVVALWFQTDTWLAAGWAPPPPLLPNIAPTVAFTAGTLLSATIVALAGSPERGRGATARTGTGAGAGTPMRAPIGFGLLAAIFLVAVVEADVWGRGVISATFQGPGGMGRFTWVGLIFLGLVLAGAVVGWLATSTWMSVTGPAVALGTLILGVAIVWLIDGGLGGPPRSTVYGLGLGITAAAAIATARSSATTPSGSR